MDAKVKHEALVLSQKVIGLANMGALASVRITEQAHQGMQELSRAGECVAPEAVLALDAIRKGMLPGQSICDTAKLQIERVLKPLQAEIRRIAQSPQGDADRARMGMGG